MKNKNILTIETSLGRIFLTIIKDRGARTISPYSLISLKNVVSLNACRKYISHPHREKRKSDFQNKSKK